MEGLEAFQRCWHGLERWSDTPTDSQQSNTFDLLLLVVPHGAAFLFFFFPLPLCRRDSTELKAARAHALCPPPLLPHFPSHTHIHTQIIIIITSSPSSSRRSQRTQKKLLFCFEPFPPPPPLPPAAPRHMETIRTDLNSSVTPASSHQRKERPPAEPAVWLRRVGLITIPPPARPHLLQDSHAVTLGEKKKDRKEKERSRSFYDGFQSDYPSVKTSQYKL